MPAFPEWEGNVYGSNSKQIFIPLHHPDIPDSKEWLWVSLCARILCLEAANSNENLPPSGMEIAHSFS